jgi:hypothetical protein
VHRKREVFDEGFHRIIAGYDFHSVTFSAQLQSSLPHAFQWSSGAGIGARYDVQQFQASMLCLRTEIEPSAAFVPRITRS